MPVTFDGPGKLIVCDVGTTSIDVKDVYSRWKEWVALGNAQFEPAMRTVGGDPVSDVKNLGATFFLTNGWRIRPQEANHRLTVVGNLYTDPAGGTPVIATVGQFSVVVDMQVSNLVDSTLAQIEEIEQSSYGGGVTINQVTGVAGTTYPIGTERMPSNNWTDAKAIADARGFDRFFVEGTWTVGATDIISELYFYGDGATFNITKTKMVLTAGCVTSGTHYHDMRVEGTQGGESNYHNCVIGALTNAHCYYDDCKMVGPVQFAAAIGSTHTTDVNDCRSGINEYVVDMNGSQLKQVYSNFRGHVRFTNGTHAGSVIRLVDHAGRVTIDPSCTAGTFEIIGATSQVVNNSTATVTLYGAAGASPVPSASAIAAAVLASLNAATIPVDAKKMNGADIIGTGQVGDDWRGVGVPPQ